MLKQKASETNFFKSVKKTKKKAKKKKFKQRARLALIPCVHNKQS
jgi:hypothetical protein